MYFTSGHINFVGKEKKKNQRKGKGRVLRGLTLNFACAHDWFIERDSYIINMSSKHSLSMGLEQKPH